MGLTQPSKATVIFWTADLRVTAWARIVWVVIRASRHWSWQVPTRRWAAPRRVGRLDQLLGRLTQQLTKDQYPVLLEYAKASFERIKQRLRHL